MPQKKGKERSGDVWKEILTVHTVESSALTIKGAIQLRSLSAALFTVGGGPTDEKHDQKATVNNSFCFKTKPAGSPGKQR